MHPDNTRQTIYQPSSPPELKIPTDLKLPNIVALRQPAKPKTSFDSEIGKPIQTQQRQVPAVAAPSIGVNSAVPLPASAKPLNTQPRLAIPLDGGALNLQQPREASGQASGAPSTQTGDLVALGVDPADSTGQISLPPGNRWGQFSLGPTGGAPGSPGGGPSGILGAGNGTGGPGGDASTGLGSGGSGGGGGNSGSSIPVMVAALGPSAGSGAMLDPIRPAAALVFPVAVSPANIRRRALVVSVGPTGGGGLNVYHALDCGNIYSIFLPMTGQNWSLQYCEKSATAPNTAVQASNSTIHLEKPLIPPDADLTQRFDFKRVPVPIELSHRTIVLKGVIAIDGTVQHLVVRQSVVPEADEAAQLAFSRWRFKPAMRDGKPIEVEILVGIPYLKEPDRINR